MVCFNAPITPLEATLAIGACAIIAGAIVSFFVEMVFS